MKYILTLLLFITISCVSNNKQPKKQNKKSKYFYNFQH